MTFTTPCCPRPHACGGLERWQAYINRRDPLCFLLNAVRLALALALLHLLAEPGRNLTHAADNLDGLGDGAGKADRRVLEVGLALPEQAAVDLRRMRAQSGRSPDQ